MTKIYKLVGSRGEDTDGNHQYSTFQILENNKILEEFSVGDAVLMSSGDINNPYVAEISSIYEHAKAKYFIAKWYYRQNDITRVTPNAFKEISNLSRDEILITEHKDINPLTTIISKCYIAFVSAEQIIPNKLEFYDGNNVRNDIYCCRYEYNITKSEVQILNKQRYSQGLKQLIKFPSKVRNIILQTLRMPTGNEVNTNTSVIDEKNNSSVGENSSLVAGKASLLAEKSNFAAEKSSSSVPVKTPSPKKGIQKQDSPSSSLQRNEVNISPQDSITSQVSSKSSGRGDSLRGGSKNTRDAVKLVDTSISPESSVTGQVSKVSTKTSPNNSSSPLMSPVSQSTNRKRSLESNVDERSPSVSECPSEMFASTVQSKRRAVETSITQSNSSALEQPIIDSSNDILQAAPVISHEMIQKLPVSGAPTVEVAAVVQTPLVQSESPLVTCKDMEKQHTTSTDAQSSHIPPILAIPSSTVLTASHQSTVQDKQSIQTPPHSPSPVAILRSPPLVLQSPATIQLHREESDQYFYDISPSAVKTQYSLEKENVVPSPVISAITPSESCVTPSVTSDSAGKGLKTNILSTTQFSHIIFNDLSADQQVVAIGIFKPIGSQLYTEARMFLSNYNKDTAAAVSDTIGSTPKAKFSSPYVSHTQSVNSPFGYSANTLHDRQYVEPPVPMNRIGNRYQAVLPPLSIPTTEEKELRRKAVIKHSKGLCIWKAVKEENMKYLDDYKAYALKEISKMKLEKMWEFQSTQQTQQTPLQQRGVLSSNSSMNVTESNCNSHYSKGHSTQRQALIVDGSLLVVNVDIDEYILTVLFESHFKANDAFTLLRSRFPSMMEIWSVDEQMIFIDTYQKYGFLSIDEYHSVLPNKSDLSLREYFYRFILAAEEMETQTIAETNTKHKGGTKTTQQSSFTVDTSSNTSSNTNNTETRNINSSRDVVDLTADTTTRSVVSSSAVTTATAAPTLINTRSSTNIATTIDRSNIGETLTAVDDSTKNDLKNAARFLLRFSLSFDTFTMGQLVNTLTVYKQGFMSIAEMITRIKAIIQNGNLLPVTTTATIASATVSTTNSSSSSIPVPSSASTVQRESRDAYKSKDEAIRDFLSFLPSGMLG